MKQLKKWFLNLSIQRKYLYCTLGITLVVLLAASFFQFMSASEIVTEQTVKQSAGVINELSVNLDHYFDMVENSFEYIANNSIVQEELESDEPYKSDGSELYSYYSRAGQIRRLLLQGYISIYIMIFSCMDTTVQTIFFPMTEGLMKKAPKFPAQWQKMQMDAVFTIMQRTKI